MGTCEGDLLRMMKPFCSSMSMVCFTKGRYLGASGYGCCFTSLASGLYTISCVVSRVGTPFGRSSGNTSMYLLMSFVNCTTDCLSMSAGILFRTCCVGVGLGVTVSLTVYTCKDSLRSYAIDENMQ